MNVLHRLAAGLVLAGSGSLAFAALPSTPLAVQCPTGDAGVSMDGYPIAAQKSRNDHVAEMAQLHGWLSSARPRQSKGMGVTAPLSRGDRVRLGLEACADCDPLEAAERRLQVGVGKPVGLELDFSALSMKALRRGGEFAGGDLVATEDGGFAWTIRLSSPKASGLRVGLSGLDLPPQAALYVFNDRGEAFGPYIGRGINGSGEVVSNLLSGDSLQLQLRVAGGDTRGLRFRIDDIGHISARFDFARRLDASYSSSKEHCTSGTPNASCVENAECATAQSWSPIDDVQSAIGAMLYRSGGGYYICTGGLIANAAGDPLFLTANHCLSKGNEAGSLEVYWNHTVACGTTSCQDAWTAQGRASDIGASILASNRTGDYTLLRLNSTLPGGAHALGWTSTPVANSNNTVLHRVSHPNGAPQAYSEQSVDTGAGTCGTLPRGAYIYSTDTYGATEGGSSGSPVLDAQGRIVGQLYGACGTNLNDSCDSAANATVDGAFAAYFPAVEAFLTDGGDGGGGGGGGDFTLSGTGTKVQGKWVANLSWSGAGTATVDIYRNDSLLTSTANTGSFRDSTSFRGGGSLTYKVCNAGSSTCSNTLTLTF